jgi:hypothetical protein
MDLINLPEYISDPKAYAKWLKGRAHAHAKRDSGRGILGADELAYRAAIHRAVIESQGRDYYTGEMLDWHLCGTYNNAESKVGRHQYKAKYNLMPTVDHYEASSTVASFKICAWRTNDSKHDMSQEAFIDLCRKVTAHADSLNERLLV